MKKTLALLALTALVAACGDAAANEGTTTTEPHGDGGRVAVGEPISVQQALTQDAHTPVLVLGYLFEMEDGTVVLADAILESYPPQPGGATIEIEGLSTDGMALEEAPADSGLATTRWSADMVEVLGNVVDGVLVYFDDPNV